jgi:RNA polymerase sigma-54 factor
MTPQLQQAIKLLQLSNLDLAAYVEEELERNPLLARGESDSSLSQNDEDRRGSADDLFSKTDTAKDEGLSLNEDAPPAKAEDVLDTSSDNLYADSTSSELADGVGTIPSLREWGSGRGASSVFDGGEPNIEGHAANGLTLGTHLTAQLHCMTADPVQRMIGYCLIEHIDERGYLITDVETLAEQLGSSPADVEVMRKMLEGCEPTGVMARSLSECLALQLKERNRLDPAMQMLLSHLELLARRDFDALKRLCGVDGEDLQDMIAELRALDPKPGLSFSAGEPVQPVIPDVFVREGRDGGWNVELNSETLPRLLVDARYYATISANVRAPAEKSYLAECYANASWLVKSLDQRAKTILKVAGEIIRQQDAFLVHGVRHLRPLNLRTIAEAISMHESTVSRVTANKYMATPRGLFEFKYFFTAAIAASDGKDAVSAEAVRDRIRELIDHESARAVLSDDRIVELLRQAGIDIARRTVAKYREAMHIPSSVERRRLKRLSA